MSATGEEAIRALIDKAYGLLVPCDLYAYRTGGRGRWEVECPLLGVSVEGLSTSEALALVAAEVALMVQCSEREQGAPAEAVLYEQPEDQLSLSVCEDSGPKGELELRIGDRWAYLNRPRARRLKAALDSWLGSRTCGTCDGWGGFSGEPPCRDCKGTGEVS